MNLITVAGAALLFFLSLPEPLGASVVANLPGAYYFFLDGFMLMIACILLLFTWLRIWADRKSGSCDFPGARQKRKAHGKFLRWLGVSAVGSVIFFLYIHLIFVEWVSSPSFTSFREVARFAYILPVLVFRGYSIVWERQTSNTVSWILWFSVLAVGIAMLYAAFYSPYIFVDGDLFNFPNTYAFVFNAASALLLFVSVNGIWKKSPGGTVKENGGEDTDKGEIERKVERKEEGKEADDEKSEDAGLTGKRKCEGKEEGKEADDDKSEDTGLTGKGKCEGKEEGKEERKEADDDKSEDTGLTGKGKYEGKEEGKEDAGGMEEEKNTASKEKNGNDPGDGENRNA